MPRKDTIIPMVMGRNPRRLTLVAPKTTSSPPTSASSTYRMFPIFPRIGISTLPAALARALSWKSCSFSTSNSFLLSSSWVNTFTTFWPFIISSIKPSSLARDFCWRIMYTELSFPSFFVTRNIRRITAKTTSVSHRLYRSIMNTMVSTDRPV